MTEHALQGLHHVTAMTDDIQRNYEFMTDILGVRLVKKTVNQDDIQTYHTFYADDVATAGTEVTFFDFPQQKGYFNQPGTNEISRIGLRVPSDEALAYYADRFDEFEVDHEGIETRFGKKVLRFQEPDGQRYQLFSDEGDEGVEPGVPWKNGPVPEEYAIHGLGPIEIRVSYYEDFKSIMESIYGFRVNHEGEDYAWLEVGAGGNGGSMILIKDTESPMARPGDGGIHHVAFKVEDEASIRYWADRYMELGLPNSGPVDRFYFKAVYARIGAILIELSTIGPGFMEDEPYETLGEMLSIPPHLEPQRDYIESVVRPFDTRPKNYEEE